MLHRLSLGCLLLVTACARVPADVSSPSSEESPTPPAATAEQQRVDVGPIASDCDGGELSTCSASCFDSECLEWCAGESCVATLASLQSCMNEAEQAFAAANPVPQMQFETVTTDDGVSYQQPTDDSYMREFEWQAAHERAVEQRWSDTCEQLCTTRLPASDDDERDPSHFCSDWRLSYGGWAQLTQPPPEQSAFGLLSMSMGTSMGLFGMFSETSISLAGELAKSADDPHTAALIRMISRTGWELRNAARCVPDLDENGREFALAIELDLQGAVQATHVHDDPLGGECVASLVASVLHLPVRVARAYPAFEVRVVVREVPDFGGALGIDDSGIGWGALGDYDSIGMGAEASGEGYGSMGGGRMGGGGMSGGGMGGGGGSIDIRPAKDED